MNNSFELVPDLKIGHIVEVSGSSIKIELSGDVTELTRTYGGRVYPIGQLGSMVKIHFGRILIFGFVTLLRMRSEELDELTLPITPEADQRLMEVELFAEAMWDSQTRKLSLSRGITTYPLPRQNVHLLTKDEVFAIYVAAEGDADKDATSPLVAFANYAGADNTVCRINVDKMIGLHCAVLGSTGSGKSGAVAGILHNMVDHHNNGKAIDPRIIILDPHGEYGKAFDNCAIRFLAYDPIKNEEASGETISLPYWLMTAEEFRMLVIGKTEFEATSQNNIVYKALTHARMVASGLVEKAPDDYDWAIPRVDMEIDSTRPKTGVSPERINGFDTDKPRPFCLEEFQKHIVFLQAVKDDKGKTKQISQTEMKPFKSILDKLAVIRRDPRIKFLISNWSSTSLNLEQVIAQLLGPKMVHGNNAPIRIIDMSGLPNEVAGPLASMIARLLFQYKLYQTVDERKRDPVLLVCEEAHRYVPDRGAAEYAAAQTAIRRIAREGRKYGIGLMLVSQRPSDIESTVISQCGTWIVLRLTNLGDQQHVARFLPDGLSGMTKALPNLAQQEAIFVGEGAALPARIRIHDLANDKLPRSDSARYMESWSLPRLTEAEMRSIAQRMVDGDNIAYPVQDKPPF
jgi:hypothetical protein